MGGVAIKAPNVATGMGRFRKVGLVAALAVAGQATGAGLLPRMIFENVNLSLVTTARNVVRSGPVAAFTTLVRWFLVLRGLPVRRLLPTVIDFFVTGFAGLRSHVLGTCR